MTLTMLISFCHLSCMQTLQQLHAQAAEEHFATIHKPVNARSPVGTFSILSSTSIPSMTWPKTVYLPVT